MPKEPTVDLRIGFYNFPCGGIIVVTNLQLTASCQPLRSVENRYLSAYIDLHIQLFQHKELNRRSKHIMF